MKALVHIGLHKTGTTSIQKTFRRFRLKLSENGFLYPIINNKSQHWFLYTYFMNNPENFHLLKATGMDSNQITKWLKQGINELDEQISSSNGHTCILSSETLSLVSKGQISSFKNFLTERFDSVRIVVYIRPEEDLYCSDLQQKVKGGQNVLLNYPLPGNEGKVIQKDWQNWRVVLQTIALLF